MVGDIKIKGERKEKIILSIIITKHELGFQCTVFFKRKPGPEKTVRE
jgi:hypothetical protein